MNNFELIDDYLTNRLGEQEKKTFEQQLISDPSLKADVDMQRHVIEGIRKARVIELKSMLNRVPVGSGPGITAIKIAASIVAAGVVGTALYFYFNSGETAPAKTQSVATPVPANPKENPSSTEKIPSQSPGTNPVKAEKHAVTGQAKTKTPAPAAEPKIEAFNPSDELVDNDKPTSAEGQASRTPVSHIVVDTDASNKDYHFHYQFANDKLMLYGAFDKSLYEILEINGGKKTVFLFYKDNYYLLSEKQKTVTPLEPITDPTLLKKLRAYRGR